MKQIPVLMIFAILSGFFPVNFALAAENKGGDRHILSQAMDIFSNEKTQSNIDAAAYGKPEEVEVAKTGIGDYFSSKWDGFKGSISKAYDSLSFPSIPNPFKRSVPAVVPAENLPKPPVSPLPIKEEQAVPGPSVLDSISGAIGGFFQSIPDYFKGTEEPVSSGIDLKGRIETKNCINDLQSLGQENCTPQDFKDGVSDAKAPVKFPESEESAGEVIRGVLSELGDYFSPEISGIRLYVKNVIRQIGSTGSYAWGVAKGIFSRELSDAEKEAIRLESLKKVPTIKDEEDNFSDTLLNQMNKVVEIAKEQIPLEDPAPSVTEPSQPVVSQSTQPERLTGRNLNWSGLVDNLIYSGCTENKLTFGPYYNLRWKADLIQEPHPENLIYSGDVKFTDFDGFGARLKVSWDENSQKWKVVISGGPYIKSIEATSVIHEDPSKSYITGNLYLNEYNNPLGIDCDSISSKITGGPGR